MKILKVIPVIIILTLINTSSYAEICSDIKMNSSVNIIKKLKCKASSNTEASYESTEVSTSEEEVKKKGILGKLCKKTSWMK